MGTLAPPKLGSGWAGHETTLNRKLVLRARSFDLIAVLLDLECRVQDADPKLPDPPPQSLQAQSPELASTRRPGAIVAGGGSGSFQRLRGGFAWKELSSTIYRLLQP